MPNPYQILCLCPSPPDLVASAFGPFVVNAVPSLDDAAREIGEREHDALLVCVASDDGIALLAGWPSLAHATMTSALVVVAPEPRPADAVRLIQLGAQDVLSAREATPDTLGRALRLAIERKQIEMAARRAYGTDLSTGLPNHAQLLEHMTHLLALREREPASMAVVVLRIEGYAGHEATLAGEGANVLRRKAAVRVRAALRASDVVASLAVDTFAVLLAWMDAPEDADGVARKLVKSLQQPFSIAGRDLAVSVNVGLSLYPAHGQDAQSLLRRAIGQASTGAVSRVGAAGDAANDEAIGQ